MKSIATLLFATLLLISCNETNKNKTDVSVAEEETKATMAYQSFGDEIDDVKVLSQLEMSEKYMQLKSGDTIDVKFSAKVAEVCQSKGCWMRLDMGDNEAMVKFKDYAFFMPKDIAGDEVIVAGKAFVNEMSVDEQRHYAEDAGKTKEEIEAITEPKRTLSFESNGVLIAEKE